MTTGAHQVRGGSISTNSLSQPQTESTLSRIHLFLERLLPAKSFIFFSSKLRTVKTIGSFAFLCEAKGF